MNYDYATREDIYPFEDTQGQLFCIHPFEASAGFDLTDVASFGLVTKGFDYMGIRSDEGNAIIGALLGKLRVLGQETVTGVDHGDVVGFGDADDLVLGQVCADRGEL